MHVYTRIVLEHHANTSEIITYNGMVLPQSCNIPSNWRCFARDKGKPRYGLKVPHFQELCIVCVGVEESGTPEDGNIHLQEMVPNTDSNSDLNPLL